MIRHYQPQDLDALMALWLATTIHAHPFVEQSYWQESEPLVRNVYIPDATTWVYCEHDEIIGFISVMEQQFIGALFVDFNHQGKGIGKALIEAVKHHYPKLLLEVYRENTHALQFYQAMGFHIVSEQPHPETKQITLIMQWQAPFIAP
ncbi:N-acetyltransferase [Budviciaceae bacterium BWR-B9]|uniref:N-acetyltransferase n=1 Tax=Limnobaculum allomyrinae TaxID=2791986 RepID=A0ABS1IPH6_9GAMM|nr:MULTISPECIES: N-acetyltransferase [Limnobaculum]MBK5143655.1 N-acetyltransferase [Limnobaculum allomyrinae]MBV7692671.1 N-acetyltransferase [Limnobaculum sp. M2-1]